MEVNEWNVVTTPSQTSSLLRLRPTPTFFPQSQTFSTKKVILYINIYLYIH